MKNLSNTLKERRSLFSTIQELWASGSSPGLGYNILTNGEIHYKDNVSLIYFSVMAKEAGRVKREATSFIERCIT